VVGKPVKVAIRKNGDILRIDKINFCQVSVESSLITVTNTTMELKLRLEKLLILCSIQKSKCFFQVLLLYGLQFLSLLSDILR